MLDSRIRPFIEPLLSQLGTRAAQQGITANQVTWTGFGIGLLVIPAVIMGWYLLALVLVLINRLCDGLDGAVARVRGKTDLGGYLDIVLDFIFYSAVIFAFCLAQPEAAIYGAFLIFSFIGTGTSFLAFAVMAEKRGIETNAQGEKSIFYLDGLVEGFETILVLALMCLLPAHFWILALGFGLLCWLSTIGRIKRAIQVLG
ncbi:MAG: phosphatidylglycerophosphate synthase [Candidatus Azotimanducaceae bacterium]|jgi:phosphatidylglycerophosphate synthase